jgi:hypothetical protein
MTVSATACVGLLGLVEGVHLLLTAVALSWGFHKPAEPVVGLVELLPSRVECGAIGLPQTSFVSTFFQVPRRSRDGPDEQVGLGVHGGNDAGTSLRASQCATHTLGLISRLLERLGRIEATEVAVVAQQLHVRAEPVHREMRRRNATQPCSP